MPTWSYRVIQVQEDRVTMDGSNWLGDKAMDADDAIDSCPELQSFLDGAGKESWEVVGMVPIAFQTVYADGGEIAYTVILKRPN